MDALDLVGFLAELGAVDGVELQRCDGTLAVALVRTPKRGRILLMERTYREGVACLLDPTDSDLDVAREGDLWRLWNDERARDLDGLREASAAGGRERA